MLVPGTDYSINGLNLVFNEPPRDRTGGDDSEFTRVTYLVGYADQEIKVADTIPWQEWQNTKIYPLRIDGASYTPTSEIGLIINKNGKLQVPFEDFTVFQDKVVFKNAIGAADLIHIRSVEYVAPSYGSGAKAIAQVDDLGQIQSLIPKVGGSKYRLDFNPKVTISHKEGINATAKSLIGGIKDVNLLDGGQGYSCLLYTSPSPRD